MDSLDYETQRLRSLRAMQACLLELKLLHELQQAASTPRPGYDVHHIVERNQEYKFSKEAIYSRENEVLVPRLKHQEINSWYQKKNPAYGGESPRDYLNGGVGMYKERWV